MIKINEAFGLNDRYTILSILGKGGMGMVYMAYDNILKESVAIKTLNNKFSTYETIKNRFLNEAKICLALTHPNIIRVRNISIFNDIYFMVMEYIDGVELKEIMGDILKEDVVKTYKLIRPILMALGYAHNYTIHRDIKPSNIMIKDNIPYLMDFGISTALNDSELDNDTIAGGMGTKKYVSPEQTFNANDVDKKTDIYSMGILMYQLFTTVLPKNTAIEDPLKPSHFNSLITPMMDSIMLKMIETKPTLRPNDFASIIKILDKETFEIENKVVKEISTDNFISLNEQSNDNFVLIKGGKFLRGSGIESKIPIEKPRKSIFLDDFYINKYCVTNSEFNEYLKKSDAKKPPYFEENLKNNPYHPVVYISFLEAKNYCKFYNLDLPSEAQWEKAAKGTKNYIYPWGNELEEENANIGHVHQGPVNVDSYEEYISANGLYNLSGNVWEWCDDDFVSDFYKLSNTNNPIAKANSELKVLKGGSFDFANTAARASFRFNGHYLSESNNIGFRTIRNIKVDCEDS